MPWIRFAIDDQPGSPRAAWEDGQLTGDPRAIDAFEMWEGFPARLVGNSSEIKAGGDTFWQALATCHTWGLRVVELEIPEDDGPIRVPRGAVA